MKQTFPFLVHVTCGSGSPLTVQLISKLSPSLTVLFDNFRENSGLVIGSSETSTKNVLN